MKKTAAFFLVILMAGLMTACNNNSGTGTTTDNTATKSTASERDYFTNMKTTNLEGEEVTSSMFADYDLTLLNVWATWCKPCTNEMPELQKVSENYKDKGVQIAGIILESTQMGVLEGLSDGEREKVDALLESTGTSYPQLLTTYDMIGQAFYDLQGFPTTYLVDKEGNLIGEPIVGAKTEEQWSKVIEENLKKVQ